MSLISINDLIMHSKKIENDKKDKIKLKINELDGEMIFRKLTFEEFLEIKGPKSDDEIIYNCCLEPNLKSDELINKLGCGDNPIDVVEKIFTRATIYKISLEILNKSGLMLDKKGLVEIVADEVKN